MLAAPFADVVTNQETSLWKLDTESAHTILGQDMPSLYHLRKRALTISHFDYPWLSCLTSRDTCFFRL
jgi:hypothetical protein